MKKIIEMKAKLEELKKEVQDLLDAGKIEEAKAKMEEAKRQKAAVELQEQLDEEERNNLKNKAGQNTSDSKTKENANIIRAMLKKVTGRTLTEQENALLLPTEGNENGENGEGYILPQDVSTLIHTKIRQYRSLREVVGYIPAGALTGSFPVENFETVTELVDFTDGTDGTDTEEVKFSSVSYSLKEKAAFIKLSNTLLAMSDTDLINYVAEVFARKAVVTENKLILTAIKKGKRAKALASWIDLKSSLNKDIDPGMLFNTSIVTNQDGFDYLDKQLDETGRPILQPDPAQPTRHLFKGYPVQVYSNSMLKTEGNKIPIFYGNLQEGVKFVDYKGLIAFATSYEAGFMSNTTVARLIEFIDAVQVDSSDKCYVYGEIDISSEAA